MTGEHSALFGVAETSAEVAASITALIGVATLDWCERAARAMLPISSGGSVGVLVANIDPDGRVVEHEATGASGTNAARLASVLDRLDHIGWKPGDHGLRTITTAPIESLGGNAWRTGRLGEHWTDKPCVLAGLAPLGDGAQGRSLLAFVSCSGSEKIELALPVFSAVFPKLVERSVLALGARGDESGGWLTSREQEVLEKLTLGMSVRQIADSLGRSPYTVHDHVKSLHRKLDASTRGELVARAFGYHKPGEIHEIKPIAHARANHDGH